MICRDEKNPKDTIPPIPESLNNIILDYLSDEINNTTELFFESQKEKRKVYQK